MTKHFRFKGKKLNNAYSNAYHVSSKNANYRLAAPSYYEQPPLKGR